MRRNDMRGPTKWRPWLKAIIRDNKALEPLPSLGALTAQDALVLDAISICWQLYGRGDYAGERAALSAIRSLLPGMQQQCWPFARELIAWAMNWNDRERLWTLVVPKSLDEDLATLDSVVAAAKKAGFQ